MLILPDRNVPRAKFLMPIRRLDWITPSQAQFKDVFGNENRQKWRIRARSPNSRRIVWQGWFEDREDADAFLWAIATGTIYQEPELWRLPMPHWDPDLYPELQYDFATSIFIISGTTQPSPADYNNGGNTWEGIGGSGSGGISNGDSATGGGGGEWRKISNFSVATPGTTAFNYVIGAGGAAVNRSTGGSTTGNAGTDTTFNSTSLVAKAGGAGQGGVVPQNGGTGGTGGTGAAGNFNGGRGGNNTAGASNGSGGGGAAGSTGVGGNGGDLATNTASNGGAADTGGTGAGTAGALAAGATPQTAGNGGAGTEWDATHGSGGGGGGCRVTGASATGTGGTGGNYGGGGGGAEGLSSGTNTTSGAGKQGILVLIYTPASAATGVMLGQTMMGM